MTKPCGLLFGPRIYNFISNSVSQYLIYDYLLVVSRNHVSVLHSLQNIITVFIKSLRDSSDFEPSPLCTCQLK